MDELLKLGWREWVGMPELGIDQLKAKLDTGARTSALHATGIRPFSENGSQRIEFNVHPRRSKNDIVTRCTADVVDQRMVKNSGGQQERRWVIRTPITIGSHTWPIEITLTARDNMRFEMLLGRTAIKGRATVNPARSYLVGRKRRKSVKKTG